MPPVRPLLAGLLAALLLAVPVHAQDSAQAARRFPQPVRVGDLIHRQVLRPVERQTVLGRVDGVARRADGAVLVVVGAHFRSALASLEDILLYTVLVRGAAGWHIS